MTKIEFTPWRPLGTEYRKDAVRDFLADMARSTHGRLRSGMEEPKSGRLYRLKGGRLHRASAKGEYPAKPRGRLAASIRSEITGTQETTGTTAFYGKWLRTGTKRMKRRAMSDTAHKAVRAQVRGRLKSFARFRHV